MPMPEITCSSCGHREQLGTEELATHTCSHCGQPRRGPTQELPNPWRDRAPSGPIPPPESPSGPPTAEWPGTIVGALIGVILTLAIAMLGEGLPLPIRN